MRLIFDHVLAILFFVFAAVQWNDPDPYLWVVLYCLVGIAILLTIYSSKAYYLLLLIITCCSVFLITYIPEVISWAKEGFPSITGSMKAETMHIEFVREFLGLLICVVVLIPYLVKVKRINT